MHKDIFVYKTQDKAISIVNQKPEKANYSKLGCEWVSQDHPLLN